ncbi:MAG TPA: M43 family zinc metalloprotease [Chryseosolibacter sp.]|nr:M43 family zinc metalloprotease [Chryseosolibacter sp.]
MPLIGTAQTRCGTVQYTKKLQSERRVQTEQDFEQWIARVKDLRRSGRTKAEPYKIPVVVHVIHNGEPVGVGTNISDAQVHSQIKVLNQDFRRENPDASNTDPLFVPVAGSMDIEFVLAKRTPEGGATTGIVRVQGSKAQWTSGDNSELKELSYWPAEDYMNLWVCDITDFLGYSQFPVSDLPGLENSSNNRLTDGVVLWYKSFGSEEDGNFNLDPAYSKGRTATHEISHFFGLRHIWGDDNDQCSGTDYVDDTPNQGKYTTGCPTGTRTSCGVTNMIQNFQDYTDDACMNLFTHEQIERMKIVIENSPRRMSLLTSLGLYPPDPVANDLGIRKIISPAVSQCSNGIQPSIQVRNYGTNDITSVRIRLRLNGNTIQTKDFALNLQPGDSANLDFNSTTVPTGENTIAFDILLTNGVSDGDAQSNDNARTQEVVVPSSIGLSFTESFGTLSTGWRVSNPDQQITWEIAEAPNQDSNNTALRLRFYDYDQNQAEQDILYTPVFDLSDVNSAVLFFDIAHARYDLSRDRLRVVALTNCGTISEGTVIYDSAGIQLATVPPTRSFFVPTRGEDWDREIVNLEQFIGETHVQLAFVGINNFGNNLYLDNISVVTHPLNDVHVKTLISPSVVTCRAQTAPVVALQNTGTETINSIDLSFGTNPLSPQQISLTSINLQPGNQVQITLPLVTLGTGENELFVVAESVNGGADDNALNNTLRQKVIVNQQTDRIPLRQNFNVPMDASWTIVNPDDGMVWQTIPTNNFTSLYFNAYNNTTVGDESWLVSPVLDFRRADEASVQFDVAYHQGNAGIEDLRILVSKNCGNTYEQLPYSLPDRPSSSGSWAPQSSSDWFENRVDLSMFARESEMRVAFVVRNANGNNLYLDNIEFFLTNEGETVELDAPYTVFGYDLSEMSASDLKVGFNLSRRQHVTCHVLNSMGKLMAEITWFDVLNQVFDLPLPEDLPSGVYIVRLGINGAFFGERILVTK